MSLKIGQIWRLCGVANQTNNYNPYRYFMVIEINNDDDKVHVSDIRKELKFWTNAIDRNSSWRLIQDV